MEQLDKLCTLIVLDLTILSSDPDKLHTAFFTMFKEGPVSLRKIEKYIRRVSNQEWLNWYANRPVSLVEIDRIRQIILQARNSVEPLNPKARCSYDN